MHQVQIMFDPLRNDLFEGIAIKYTGLTIFSARRVLLLEDPLSSRYPRDQADFASSSEKVVSRSSNTANTSSHYYTSIIAGIFEERK